MIGVETLGAEGAEPLVSGVGDMRNVATGILLQAITGREPTSEDALGAGLEGTGRTIPERLRPGPLKPGPRRRV